MTGAAPTPGELRALDLFDGLDDAQLAAWAAAADAYTVQAGEIVARQGDEAPGLTLVLEGTLQAILVTDGREEPLGEHVAPTWIGAVAAMTGSSIGVCMKAQTPARLALIPADAFVELAIAQRPVFQRVMATIGPVMARVTAVEQNRERLASLGTMAAGLAHELNNPAAAAKRSAEEIVRALDTINHTFGSFVESGVEREQAEQLVRLQRIAVAHSVGRAPQSALADADAEDAMIDLLEEMGVQDAWSVAEPLAAAGLDADWLAQVQANAGAATESALRWAGASMTARHLAAELQESADRMSALVGAVKSYAYMDRGALVAVDVREGLDATVTILGHKLKQTAIEIVRDYDPDLPPVTVRGSELNQVWTNLIDNAIDALGEQGTITLTTRRDGSCVEVDIADDGPGIPDDVAPQVFDPFYTTKGVGAGTGLGLDTARRIVEERHTGTLRFDTGPQGTTFHVRLPLEGTAR